VSTSLVVTSAACILAGVAYLLSVHIFAPSMLFLREPGFAVAFLLIGAASSAASVTGGTHSLRTGRLGSNVDWYLSNMSWVEGVITGEYLEYCRRLYGNRGDIGLHIGGARNIINEKICFSKDKESNVHISNYTYGRPHILMWTDRYHVYIGNESRDWVS